MDILNIIESVLKVIVGISFFMAALTALQMMGGDYETKKPSKKEDKRDTYNPPSGKWTPNP